MEENVLFVENMKECKAGNVFQIVMLRQKITTHQPINVYVSLDALDILLMILVDLPVE